jgi:UDP-N-acetylglucosamine 2-epimerase (non-hydrolysing)
MKNIVFIVGTRPNFIKVAPMLKEIQKKYSNKINPILIHTGQHYDFNMSDIFCSQLDIVLKPVCFNISSGTPAQQIGEIMKKFELYLKNSNIDLVVVVGDVNSSMAASLVAAQAAIPIAHVEAGLRSFDKSMPEEINRIIIDSLSTFFFTTEPSADENLKLENHKTNIYRVGNVMIDALKNKLLLASKLNTYKKYNLIKKKYIVLTLHRPSNVDNKDKLFIILNTIKKISQSYKIIFLIHPRTQRKIKQFEFDLFNKNENIIFEPPVGYLENLNLMKNSRLVLTDSGGMQEETTFLGVPCITLRKNTERPITVSYGTNIIAGDDESLYEQIILNTLIEKNIKKNIKIPLWDGRAAQRIMKIIWEDACRG